MEKITKKMAIQILIDDFHNNCIARDWDIPEDDYQIALAFKLDIPESANKFLREYYS